MAAAEAGRRYGRLLLTLAVAAAAAALSPRAAAGLDLGPRDVGLRAGLNLQPDQLGAGMDVQLGRGGRLALRPVAEAGIGNGVRMLALSGDLLHPLGRGRGRYRAYLGAGPGLRFIDVTNGVGEGRGLQTKVVANVVAGLVQGGRRAGKGPSRRYLGEVRVGIGDTPRLSLVVGASF